MIQAPEGWEYVPTEPSNYVWSPYYQHVDCPKWSDTADIEGEEITFFGSWEDLPEGGAKRRADTTIICPTCKARFSYAWTDWDPEDHL